MLFKKLWRTMRLYRAQFVSMLIMIAIGTGIFVGFNMEWYSIEGNTSPFFEETGYADYRIISEKGYSDDDLKKISDIEGVDNAGRYINFSADVKEREDDAVSLTVTTNEKVSGMLVTDGEKYDAESTDGVWLSDKYAVENDFEVGDGITLSYKGIELDGTIKGLIKSGEQLICVRDSSQLMPDYSTFGFAYISPAMYENAIGRDYYTQINVISSMSKKDFTQSVDDALGNTALIITKDESASYAGAHGEVEEGQTMGSILPTLFLLIAVLTMVTTMHRLTAKEKTQIGTLKALGFKNRRILMHYTTYAFEIGIIGSAIGVGLGFFIAHYIMNPNGMMGTYFDMPEWKLYVPNFCYYVLAAIIVVLTLIGFLSVRKMLKGTAADALRPYSPKKMKPMLIERTRLFHKLSFGTRWNLRDIVRHKSRTAMSLVGIVGCTLLVMASFGLRDTMNAFLDTYYDGAMKYSSRIYFTETATDEQKNKLAEKYDADLSASVSVQAEDKTASVDVYKIEHELIAFPGDDTGYVKLPDDGALICERLAEEFNVKEGDELTFSPFGTDKEYTVKISKIMRSVSESIAISSDYAKKIELPFAFDSAYTKTQKSDISTDSSVKSVQSRQMIIDSFETFIELFNTMIVVLVLGALVLGIVVLYNLGIMSYTERYRELATLKVVGFKDKKIGQLLIGQNLWLSLIGVILGIPAGIGALDYMLKALAREYEMKLQINVLSIVISVALTVGMSLLVSLMVSRKNKHIDMVEALKGAE